MATHYTQPAKFNEYADATGQAFHTSSSLSVPIQTGAGTVTPDSHAQALTRFFGIPTKEVRQNPYARMPKEILVLPEAYVGSNPFLTEVTIRTLTETDLFPLRSMLPFERYEGSGNFQWKQIIMHNHMLGRVPELGAPHLVTQSLIQRSANAVRFGLGLEVEHGFYLTEAGQQQWALHLMQIANAAMETAAYGAVVAALESTPHPDLFDKFRMATARSIMDLEGMFMPEIAAWAAIQKPDAGVAMICGRAERAIASRGSATADTWLWPEGTKDHAQGSDLERLYYLSGRRSGEERDVVNSATGSDTVGYSRGFISNDQEPAHDPNFRNQTIGTFFQCDAIGVQNVDAKEYRTSMKNRIVYNENRDSMQTFSYQDSFKYSGLFQDWDNDKQGLKLSHIGQEFFGNDEFWLDYLKRSDENDYCIATLLAKPLDVHQDFLTAVVNRTLIELGVEAPALAAHQNALQGHMNHRHQGQGRTQAAMTHLNAADATAWSPEAKAQAKAFSRFLAQLPDRGIPLVDAYAGFVRENANSHLSSVYNASWAYVSSWLVDYDQLGSLAQLEIDSRFETTVFEKTYNSIRTQALNSSDDSQVVSQLKKRLNQADAQSPTWAPVAGKHPLIQLRVTPFASPQQFSRLPYRSLSFTLSSIHLMLLLIDGESMKTLTANKGAALFNLAGVSSDDEILNEAERFASLQFSVTLSAVFTLIEQYVQRMSSDNQVSDSARRNLSKQISSIVPMHESHSGQSSVMQKAAARAHQLPVLTTQKFAEKQIVAVAAFLARVYESMQTDSFSTGDLLPRGLEQSLQLAIAAIQEQSENFEVSQLQSSTGARFSESRQRDERILSTKVVDKDGLASLKTAAEKTVDALHAQLVKVEADRELYTDSFNTYRDSYVYIYQLLHVHPKLFAGKDFDKVFEAIVKTSHKFFSSKKELPHVLTREYLKLVTASLVNQDAQKIQDLNLLSDVEAPVTRDSALKRELLQNINGRTVQTQNEVATVLQQLRSGFGQKTSFLVNFSTQSLLPEGVTEFEDLQKEAFARFPVENSVAFAYALAIWWKRQLNNDPNKNSNELITKYGNNQNQQRGFVVAYLDALLGNANTDPTAQKEFNKAKVIMGKEADDEKGTVAKSLEGLQQPLTRTQLERILKSLPINGKFVKWCLQRDVHMPIQLLCFRPMMRYSMGSAVHLAGRGKTGKTLIANADFMLGDNPVQKKHYGDYTQNQASVILNPRNLIVMHNVLCRDYLGGNGTQCWDPLDDDHLDAYGKNVLIADVFVVAERENWKTQGSVLDLTGQFHSSLRVDRQANDATRYTCSKVLCDTWGWTNRKAPYGSPYNNKYDQARFNTLCFESYSRYYNHSTKLLSTEVSEKGHWANCVYEGCGSVRRGNSHQFKVHRERLIM